MSLEIAVAAMILSVLSWGWSFHLHGRQIRLMKDMMKLQAKMNELDHQVWKKG